MPLFPYQIEGVKKLINNKRFLLADDPGAGKTCQLVKAGSVLCEHYKKNLDILVIATKSICINWKREIKKWNGIGNYTVINHDKLIGKKAGLLKRKWHIVIADESHIYLKTWNLRKNTDPNSKTKKTWGSRRQLAFLEVIKGADYVWLSTATAASRSAEDYYLTLKLINPGVYGGWTKIRFLKRYCNEVYEPFTYDNKKYIGFRNQEELKKAFSTCALKRKLKDIQKDLPPMTITDFYCDVKYSDLQHFTPEEALDIKKRVLRDNSLSDEYQSRMRHNALLKIPAVLEILNTYPRDMSVVIFAWHRDVVQKLHQEINDNCEDRIASFITGEITSEKERQRRIDGFQGGLINTLIINMQSGGVGINLTKATKGIYIQFPYSAAHWKQSMHRIHRIGTEKPVQVLKLMVKDSIDEDIFEVLQERLKGIEEVGV